MRSASARQAPVDGAALARLGLCVCLTSGTSGAGAIAKHGIDFDEIELFQWSGALIEPDDRHDEPRFRAFGYIGLRLHTVVYTERMGNTRVISIRKSNEGEMKRYAAP